MKKHVLSLLFTCCACTALLAQAPSYRQKLYYTGKVWGFVKYFHSQVSTCQVNWDSVLISKLPAIKNAASSNDFNDVLRDMIIAAGPMAIGTSPFTDTTPAALKKNRDFTWTTDVFLRADVRAKLDTIRQNFRPHTSCWVQLNDYSSSYTGFLVFPKDSLMTGADLFASYPSEEQRILLLYKYWNIIRYFNPYNYVLDKPCDSILSQYADSLAAAPDAYSYYLLFEKVTKHLDDAHTEGLTWDANVLFPCFYTPYLQLRYVQNKYVVAKSNYTALAKGDIIKSVDGLTVQQWEDSLRPYISAGNPAVFRRFIQQYMLGGNFASSVTIVSEDDQQQTRTTTVTRNGNPYAAWFDYYPNDTLKNVKYQSLQCDAGYVNMGKLQLADVNQMCYDMQAKKTMIYDLRNYPNGTAFQLADMIYPQRKLFSKISIPVPEYPGSYAWFYDSLGLDNNPYVYTGKVLVLMNEETQSQAEFSCMILKQMPNALLIGSQTAGADGNITYFRVSPDLRTGFTSLGIFYPNGDSTQRIGIVPDIYAAPTINGMREGRDEVLEKALEIACALYAGVEQQPAKDLQLAARPNPFIDQIQVDAGNVHGNTAELTVMDLAGKTVYSETLGVRNGRISKWVQLPQLSKGIYFARLQTDSGIQALKLVKQ